MTLTTLLASLPANAHVLMGARTIRQGADRHAPIYAVAMHGVGHYSARRI